MLQGVESHQISGTEDGAFRAGSCGPGNGVHLLHGHPHLDHMTHTVADGIDADPVGNEVGGVLGKDDPLPEALLNESCHEPDHFRIGEFVRDDLQKAHVARRIEEMSDKKVFPHVIRKTLGHLVHGKSARVGRENGALFQVRADLLAEEALLDLHPFNDDLNDPVTFLKLFDIVVEITRFYIRSICGEEKCRGLHFPESFESRHRDPVSYGGIVQGKARLLFGLVRLLRHDVEYQHPDACIREVGGDGRSHYPRTQDSHFVDLFHHIPPSEHLLVGSLR